MDRGSERNLGTESFNSALPETSLVGTPHLSWEWKSRAPCWKSTSTARKPSPRSRWDREFGSRSLQRRIHCHRSRQPPWLASSSGLDPPLPPPLLRQQQRKPLPLFRRPRLSL